MSSIMDESIAVFPASLLSNYQKSGFYKFHSRLLDSILKHTIFQRRGDMEINEAWRQLIPYVYVYDGKQNFLAYRRSLFSGERRLHAKTSIGFGGHITEADQTGDLSQLLTVAGLREVCEELVFKQKVLGQLVPSGFVVSHDTPVDRVHFGVALALKYCGDVAARDLECEILGWKSRKELLRDGLLENWSQHIVQGWAK